MIKLNTYRNITSIFFILFIFISIHANTDNKEKKFLSVVKECTKKINGNNRSWYTYQKRGGAYFNLKQYKNAIYDFNQSILLKNDNIETYRLKAKALYFLKDLNTALKTINKAIKHDTEDRMLRFDRGVYLYELKKLTKAINDFTFFINLGLKPGHLFFTKYLRALLYRATSYYSLQKYDKALTDYIKLSKYDYLPKKYTFSVIAACYFELKQYDKSLINFKKLLKYNPADGLAYMHIAWIYAKRKDLKNTKKYIIIGLQTDLKSPRELYMKDDFIKLLGKNEINNLIDKYSKE